MGWFTFRDKAWQVKMHHVDESLREQLIAKLKKEYKAELWIEESSTKEEIHYEPGGYGMYATNQPRVVLDVNGKKLRVDVIKVEELLCELSNAVSSRFADGTEYYTLYSRMQCLVLTPNEKEELVFQLTDQLPALKAQGGEWLDNFNKSWSKLVTDYENKNGKDSFPILRVQDAKNKKDSILN